MYNFRDRRALLLESNTNNRMLFEFALLMGRIDFESANHSDHFLELWQPDTYAFVIMNVDMEDRDGLELARYVRESDPEVAILVFSINDEPDDVRRVVDAGCDLYVAMPFQLEVLLTLVKIIDAQTLRLSENVLIIDNRTRPRWETRD